MQEWLWAGVMLLAVYGLSDLVWRLACFLVYPHRVGVLVVPMKGDREDAERLARAAVARGERPIVLDCGMTPESAALTREICEKLGVAFAQQKEWEQILKTALQERKKRV